MATKDDVKQAIADEKAEIQAALTAQDAKITALQAQVDAGGSVSSADFEELRAAVKDIFTPAP